jgi:hypothetical protein
MPSHPTTAMLPFLGFPNFYSSVFTVGAFKPDFFVGGLSSLSLSFSSYIFVSSSSVFFLV